MIQTSTIPKTAACAAVGVSRSGYYKTQHQTPIPNHNDEIKSKIEQIVVEFPGYGYRRVTKELHRRNVQVNHKKILRIMRKNNLLCRRKKRFKPITTQSNHGLRIYPNLAKNLVVTGFNQLWVADITYIHLPRGFVYLAAILDIFSRKCIGWELSRNIDAQLTLNALNMAVSARQHLGFSELIHHSDRGVQYAANDYVKRLKDLGIQISMSGKGNAYDNAYAESFMKTFKVEEVYIKEYQNITEAYANIKHFIELVYNEKRLHSGIGYVPPNEFEQEALNRQKHSLT